MVTPTVDQHSNISGSVSITQHVADAVNSLMRSQQVTRDALAEGTGIPRTTLFRKLNAHSAFAVDELERIAGVLDVEPASLLPQQSAQASSAVAS